MKSQRQFAAFTLVILVMVSTVFGTGQAIFHVQGASQPDQTQVNAVVERDFGKLPLSFVPNVGQTDQTVRFQVNSLGGTLFFKPQEVVLSLPQPNDAAKFAEHKMALRPEEMVSDRSKLPENQPPLMVKMQLIGANGEAEIVGADPLAGIVNYFIGNDPSQWHTNIPTYAGITYRDVYPGTSLHYDGYQGHLKGTYTVAPNADPSMIRWRYEGNTDLSIDPLTGDLLITLPNGRVLREVAPTAWQEKLGKREAVHVSYALDEHTAYFVVSDYADTLPLIIDPSFQYSTYFGGGGEDDGFDIAVDAMNSAYITGETQSANFPVLNALQGTYSGGYDVVIMKLTPSGNELVYSTYLGGSQHDGGNGITVDNVGGAYITGYTQSTNFPIFNALQGTLNGQANAFVTKLSPSGASLVYSTYLGGENQDAGSAIAVDSAGSAYIAGLTRSSNFPTLNAFQALYKGGGDAFVAKLSTNGATLVYSTYLGGDKPDYGNDLALDSSGNTYIVGATESANFPVFNALQGIYAGDNDVFVTKLNASGTGLIYSTFLGGLSVDWGYAIAVDSAGSAYVTGDTSSPDFPVFNALQSTKGGLADAFVAKLNANGNGLLHSTYLGGTNSDAGYGIAVDSVGNAYVTGYTSSSNFPIFNALQDTLGNQSDAFVTKLGSNNSGLSYSTYLGGDDIDYAYGVAVDGSGNAYVTGITASLNFPIYNPLQGSYNYNADGFVTKINDSSRIETIGIFRPSVATFYLRNSNTTGFADRTLTFGASTDFPIAGDWNGDGIDTPGVYRQSTGQFFLTDSTTNPAALTYSLVLGIPNDQPIVGDWDGDGKDSVGVFRPSNGLIYLKNELTTGIADFTMVLGVPGDVGIAGDWNGDGKDSPGVYRPANQVFYLTNSVCNCSVFADAELVLGIAGDTPFVGDWDGNGQSGVGVYRQSNGLTYIKNALTTGFADSLFVFGNANDYPLAGYWVRNAPPLSESAPTFQPAH
ncbi:MAG: SBBP repeat-containing protein [Anaerolineae bacterium]|nr:SBBP repeat-containing protein [Anaerolineae bacterium]